eukprot:TRINITY_DN30143_c0_g1_i1.p1 TRINITY_DN30143_c0_g1~~TRINITY_DN30143_c0_g1_i1.p1  ORF type:complete len:121 (-),score=12.17 TRINITY_DN30143_c0_g1_i1:10-372(-)
MAEKMARQLRVLEVEGDSTVGLLMTNDSAEAIASIYGVLIAGGAYVPLDPSYPDARSKLMAEDAEVTILLVKDKDALVKIGGIVKCPVLSVMNIIDDAFLPEPGTVAWRPPTINTSCYVM